MTTQRALLESHRKGLDAEFSRRYPRGRFTLQDCPGPTAKALGQHAWSMHWCPRRATSRSRKPGISTYWTDGAEKHSRYQNSSFGKVRHFATFRGLLQAANRAGVPSGLIEAFGTRYVKRADEGFPLFPDEEGA